MPPIATVEQLIEAVGAARGRDDQERDVVRGLAPAVVRDLLHATVDGAGTELLAAGIAASPGSGTGRVYFDCDRALDALDRGEPVVLARVETTPADEPAMRLAEAIVTAKGGLTSHAAVVARGLGVPAVCGVAALDFGDAAVCVGDRSVPEGAYLTVDGSTGEVRVGQGAAAETADVPELAEVLAWADRIRGDAIGVRANADTGADAEVALDFGADGIGLCRTEHLFLGDRLPLFQRYLLAPDGVERAEALAEVGRAQEADLVELLRVMDARPVTVRLLDPPLHEFLPPLEDLIAAEARGEADAEQSALLAAAREWHEHNPMIGTRGVRLAILRPELYRMQVAALIAACQARRRAGGTPIVEIMVPFVVDRAELATVRADIETLLDGADLDTVTIGAMVETPRAALLAGSIATEADFLSLGTNDLTQTTYAFSRDDVEARILTTYIDAGLLDTNPFETIDRAGVGALVEGALFAARAARPGIKIGVCGEHGGDPASVAYFVALGLDYVSCSPYRVPVARLAAAQAVLDRS